MLGVGCLLLVGGGAAYQLSTNRPNQQSAAVNAAPTVETVSALGRLEPEGEVIQVFAPTSMEGARVETLRVTHGQQIRKGDVIAVLDTYTRRQAALQEALEQVEVAQAQLSQVEAGAKSGQIRAQSRVVDRQQVELQTETEAQEAAIARLKAELNNAELEARRYQVLYTDGAVSASLRDGKQLTADIVRQQLNGSQANLSRIQRSRQQQVFEAEATLEQIAEVRPVDVNVRDRKSLRH
jgi:HlyD family secretion protein